MKKLMLSLMILSICSLTIQGQKKSKGSLPAYTPATERWDGYQKRLDIEKKSIVKNIEFRNVGPTIMSGRVVDIEVDPTDPSHFYVAYASGGLWETTNEGASFNPIFDNQIVMTIGDIAIDWENQIIYLGSGENNSSRSSYSGYGMFKSTDNGVTWNPLGLEETHHIGRIILHPGDPNIIWVAALGHLYSENPERGLYKSIDAGKTWTKTLEVDARSGIVELVIHPNNPDELVAGAWDKDRKAWNFRESGNGSGLFKSSDGGESWIDISSGENGFPDTKGMGRVGIDYASDGTIFVVLDNQDRRDKEEDKDGGLLTKEMFRTMSNEEFQALDNNDINDFLDDNDFPEEYNAIDIKEDFNQGNGKPVDLAIYLEDANSMLFDTPVKGGEVYKSSDGGDSWEKVHEDYIESFVFSYGYYFGQIRVDAQNSDQLYILGVPVLSSEDGGKTWSSIGGSNVHADHHALWINPAKSGHLICGNDGGINISYDNGSTWTKCNSAPVGQFYSVNYDMAKPYNVYGGLQDNGVWKGPSTYEFSNSWQQRGKYPYEGIMGGDGMQVQIDSRDNETVYTGYQFGNYFRINTSSGERKYITPKHKLGENPFRWNWQAPILLSPHNQDIVYFGSNRFHRSLNQGDDWVTMSGDLTNGGQKGDVSYGTLTTISESPLRFGLIYVGSDDGLIHVSKDAGQTWSKVSNSLPKNFWVSRVYASHHKEGRVYASLNGYRWDNFKPMVYLSEDYGKTWKTISANLPDEPVNAIKEDPNNENIIYIGTDHGAFVSFDKGTNYHSFVKGLPNAPVHDLAIHPRDNDLILGTHGRSIFIADVDNMQKLPDLLTKNLHLFDLNNVNYSDRWGRKWWTWGDVYEPEMSIEFFSGVSGTAKIEIFSDSVMVNTLEVDAEKGMNFVSYDLTVSDNNIENFKASLDEDKLGDYEVAENGKSYLPDGNFKVILMSGDNNVEGSFKIKKRPEQKRKGSD